MFISMLLLFRTIDSVFHSLFLLHHVTLRVVGIQFWFGEFKIIEVYNFLLVK